MSNLSFDQVTVRYGAATILDGVSLTVPDGQVVGLVGESGSGKSTLARAAVGLAPLAGGRILLDGADVPRKGRHRPLQMVFQDPYSSLDPRMTIGESIAEAMSPDARAAPRVAPRSRASSSWSISTRPGPAPSRLSSRAASVSASLWRAPSPADPRS